MNYQLPNGGGGKRASILSQRRANFTFGLAFLAILVDMFATHILGVTTWNGLLEQTVVSGLGLYLEDTILAFLFTDWKL